MLHLLIRVVLVPLWLLRIDEVVGVVVQGLADDEGSFPRRGQLVHAPGVLDQPEHQITRWIRRLW